MEVEGELKKGAISFFFHKKNKCLWIAMVTCMQDITGQQVRRDSFLKFPFLLHTLNVAFHPVCFEVTSCPGLQGGFYHCWEKSPLRIQACNHQLEFSLSNTHRLDSSWSNSFTGEIREVSRRTQLELQGKQNPSSHIQS